MSKQPLHPHIEAAVSAAKFAVRALLTVCAGTLLLLSAGESRDAARQEAMAELDALLNIDYRSQLAKIVIEEVPNAKPEVDALRKIFEDFKLQLSLSNGNLVVAETAPDGLQSATGKTTLAKHDDIFRSVKLIKGEVRNIRQSDELIRQSLASMGQHFEGVEAPVGLSFGLSGQHTEISMSDGRTILFQTTVFSPIGATDYSIPVDLMEKFSQMPETELIVKRQSASSGYIFLPATKSFWPELRDRPVGEAFEYLARKGEPAEQTLNIFGLQFPKQHVSWIVPLLVFGISIYLWIYLQNIVKSGVDEYPWIHLMQGIPAAAISVALIGVLPVVTLVCTAIVTWNNSGRSSKVFSALCGLFALIFLVRSLGLLPPVKGFRRALSR